MADPAVRDSDLTQAVRIVLKYEIQSLLTRLADTGEEYLVLTASSDEKTCGHIGSTKGETFLQNSRLQNVKQEFLNFCSGLPAVVKEEQEECCTTLSNVASASKQHRRKNIPRCISQQNSNDSSCTSLEKIGNPVTSIGRFESSDSSDKFNDNVSDLTNWNHADTIRTIIKTEPLDNDSHVVLMQNTKSKDDVLNNQEIHKDSYLWFEEKFQLPNEGDNYNDDDARIQKLFKQKQKVKRDLNVSSLVKDDTIVNPSTTVTQHGYGDIIGHGDVVGSNAGIQAAPSGNLSKITKLEQTAFGHKFTDMKSAFIEIGNMAKCLLCNKILSNKHNRTFHWRSHIGDKRYACDICNKRFTHPSNMKSHRKIHMDERPFPCDVCGHAFRRRNYLLQHMERFHMSPSSGNLLDNSGNTNSIDNT